MEKRDAINSPRLSDLKRKRRKIFWIKFVVSLFLLLVFFFGLAWVSKIDRFNISAVEVSGNLVTSGEAIQEIINQDLAGKYLWLFPKTNIFIYPKEKMAADLALQFRRLSDAHFYLKNSRTLAISIKERVAQYIWCGKDLPSASVVDEKCYFMDNSGYVFDEAPFFSGPVYLKFYGGTLGGDPTGNYYVEDIWSKLLSFHKAILDMGLKPVAVYVSSDIQDITVLLPAGISGEPNPKILLKGDADIEKIAGNLQTALTTTPFKSDFKNKYSKLLYIDLRFGNKVYYKFQ